MKPSKHLLIYMAGFFDGEGSIILIKTKTKSIILHVTVSQVNIKPLKLFKKYYGGYLYIQKRTKTNQKDCGIWRICSLKAEKFLKDVYKYLIVKRRKAKLALDFKSIPNMNSANNFKNIKSKSAQRVKVNNNIITAKRKYIYNLFYNKTHPVNEGA